MVRLHTEITGNTCQNLQPLLVHVHLAQEQSPQPSRCTQAPEPAMSPTMRSQIPISAGIRPSVSTTSTTTWRTNSISECTAIENLMNTHIRKIIIVVVFSDKTYATTLTRRSSNYHSGDITNCTVFDADDDPHPKTHSNRSMSANSAMSVFR